MRRLSLIIGTLVLLTSMRLLISSPHGDNFKVSCEECHTTDGWVVNPDSIRFSHDSTAMPLTGQHKVTGCRSCHKSLIFEEAEPACSSCHTDLHENSVGPDCERCHNTGSWIISDIIGLHRQTRFPLLGAHSMVECSECHVSASSLRFEPLGIECVDCHRDDYLATDNPNHQQSGYSTNCTDCHFMSNFTWSGAGINHDFFPLREGHDIQDCSTCHTQGTFNKIPRECSNCHQPDYLAASNPNHVALNFSNQCNECHTLAVGWKPAEFKQHDGIFPIYSGTHNGEWVNCSDCHKNSSDYGEFTCTDCHEHNKSDMDNEHDDVAGYEYNSIACLGCHPSGSGEGAFNHNSTGFPLTGAHRETGCSECHVNNNSNPSTFCYDCHTQDFNESDNPDHQGSNIPNTCADCHTTEPGWKPATFAIHDQYYELTGAHNTIEKECADCHAGNYSNTPNTCSGCHTPEYNQSVNPNHIEKNIPNTCEDCHSTSPGWAPAAYPMHNEVFAFNGAHQVIANDCASCHAGNYVNTPNTCSGCHLPDYNQTTNPQHASAQFPTDCLQCHNESAWQPSTFQHDGPGYFPIYSGAHNGEWDNCSDCHTNSANFSVFSCINCHEHNKTDMDEEHSGIDGYSYNSADCYACHPDGSANGAFNHNNTSFPLTGAHTGATCSECHTNGYTGTSSLCYDCHQTAYTGTANPNHTLTGIPTTCSDCHTTNAGWAPATFPIHDQYYVFNGAHIAIASECASCHNGNYNSTPTTCSGCHMPDYNSTTSPSHITEQFPTECLICHNETAWIPSVFNHQNTSFPLTGAHTGADCSECHQNGYTGTTSVCYDCHQADFIQSLNPNHTLLNIPNTCSDCHTTQPGWAPATFPIHNQYYQLNGAHAAIANDCNACHNGNYNNTPNTCAGCHIQDYNSTTNPNHAIAQYPTDCLLCHTETAWVPSTFNHDIQYFPIYSGEHQGEWNTCSDCHPNPSNYAVFTCLTCHEQAETDQEHEGIDEYIYNSNACLECHPTGSTDKSNTLRRIKMN